MFRKRPQRSDGTIAEVSKKPQRAAAPKSRVGRLIIWLIVAVLCLALGVAGFYLVSANMALSRIQTIPSALPPVDTAKPRPSEKGVLNYLLLGTDSRVNDSGQALSDTLMLAHVNEQRNQVYLISFNRDMWVKLHGKHMDKINAAYSYGGPALSVATIQDLLGIHIDHVAQIGLDGFVGLTDAIGGVDIFNPVASRDHLRNCYPYGDIHISGGYALYYVRQRSGLPGGDFDRAQRQRIVTKAILARLMQPEVLLNPPVFLDVTNKFADFIQVDETLTPDKIRNTALSMRIGSSDDIKTLQAPLLGYGHVTMGGIEVSIVKPDLAKMKELGVALNNDTMDQYYEKYGNSAGGMAPSKPDDISPTPSPGAAPTSTVTSKPKPSPIPSEIYCKGYNPERRR